MTQLLILVTDEQEYFSEILSAWEGLGVPGVTMIDTKGARHTHDETRDDLPFVVSLRAVLENAETPTRTFFSVIENEQVCEQAVEAVLKIFPDFNQGHRGILFTLPVTRVWGYTRVAAR